VADMAGREVKARAGEICQKIATLLGQAKQGRIYRDGVETVIIGRPNVGKSSLLNALLREERAIVTEVAGTTRDQLSEYVNIRGIPIKIVDTAGIRKTKDQIEVIGVERARSLAQKADLIIFMLNGAEDITREDREIALLLANKKVIVMINKTDLAEKVTSKDVLESLGMDGALIIKASLLKGEGLIELEESIEQLVFRG
jgi:tRNA modification GTPase